jgi:predicted RNA binding protein YcfA (HicA-like mRNA interferase family)
MRKSRPFEQAAGNFGPGLHRRLAKELGFAIRRQHGSHIILRREDPFRQVVVPDHRVLDRGTLREILRQVGLSVDQFNELL